jgi:N-sulfoglucosamine sulfohydrolase
MCIQGMNQRPNILFAVADDASHMSAYGHRFLHTPHFDRVAREGVLFNQAFTTNPKCAPSRACILTGMHTWQLEEACNHFGLFSKQFAVYPDLLEQAGYHVGYTGKGWGPGDFWRGGFTRNPAGAEYNVHTLAPPGNTALSPKDYATNFAHFLQEHPDGAPFCFWYGGHEPHRPYREGEGLAAGKQLSNAQVPPYLPDHELVRSDLLDYAYEIEWFDSHLGRMLQLLEERGELDNTLIIVTSDNGMPFPRVKGQMYEQDFRLPLAMCWKNRIPGDRVVDDLVSFIDLAPTMLEAAGVPIHSQMAGSSLLSILLSNQSGYIDEQRTQVVMGKERHDLGREHDVGYPVRCLRTRTHLYVRNFTPERWPAGNPETGFTNTDNSPTKSYVLRLHEQGESEYFELAFGKRPAEELFDIQSDPDCMNNLADLSEYADLKEVLWEQLKRTLLDTQDPRMEGKGDIFDTYEYVGKANAFLEEVHRARQAVEETLYSDWRL